MARVAGVARDFESIEASAAALTERRGSCERQLAGLWRCRETCGGRGAGLTGALGRRKGQVAGVARNLDAPGLPLAAVTALWRSLLGSGSRRGRSGRQGGGSAGGEEALGKGAIELLAGIKVVRLILLAQVAGDEGFGSINELILALRRSGAGRWSGGVVGCRRVRQNAVGEGCGWLERYELLMPALIQQDDEPSLTQLAVSSGTTAGALRVTLHRMRGHYRSMIKRELALTLDTDDPKLLREEMVELLKAFA